MGNIFYHIKVFIYKLMPKSYKQKRQLAKIYFDTIDMDKERLTKYGFSYSSTTENLLSDLRMKIHFLEKGLTMPEVRPCFGIRHLPKIVEIVEQLGEQNIGKFEMQYLIKIINEYLLYHKERNIILTEKHYHLINKITKIIGSPIDNQIIRQPHYDKNSFFNINDGDFSKIAQSRHSVRNYINKSIPKEVLINVAEIANKAPSACNRQPCRMYIVTQTTTISQIINLGLGCNGFGHLIPTLIIITSDLICRDNITERFQVGIDAGFFGMNLLYALHEKGIGACVLNWDNIRSQDKRLRELIPIIPDNETIVFLISCGYTPKEFDVPLGLKKANEEIIKFV